MWTVDKARAKFKGGKPNDRPGFKVLVRWEIHEDLPDGTMLVDKETMEGLAAGDGDLVYVCDKRWWLGGLRSTHGTVQGSHDHGEVVYLAKDLADNGHFLAGKMIVLEKEM